MDVKIYCLKCKLTTVTNNVECVVTKNNRSMIKRRLFNMQNEKESICKEWKHYGKWIIK